MVPILGSRYILFMLTLSVCSCIGTALDMTTLYHKNSIISNLVISVCGSEYCAYPMCQRQLNSKQIEFRLEV